MRKSILILALLLSGITYTSYSQKLSAPLLREINTAIAEGIECKQILLEKSNQVAILQKLNNEQSGKIDNLNKQIALMGENNTIAEGRERAAMDLVNQCNDDKAQSEKDVVRLKKARNRYAWIAAIETLVIAGIVYLSIR